MLFLLLGCILLTLWTRRQPALERLLHTGIIIKGRRDRNLLIASQALLRCEIQWPLQLLPGRPKTGQGYNGKAQTSSLAPRPARHRWLSHTFPASPAQATTLQADPAQDMGAPGMDRACFWAAPPRQFQRVKLRHLQICKHSKRFYVGLFLVRVHFKICSKNTRV